MHSGGLISVPIQLIAPASGAVYLFLEKSLMSIQSFHSTDCPSEWGLYEDRDRDSNMYYVSIQLIAQQQCIHPLTPSFHSTDCPSEWGPANSHKRTIDRLEVSIQLIAPASGA